MNEKLTKISSFSIHSASVFEWVVRPFSFVSRLSEDIRWNVELYSVSEDKVGQELVVVWCHGICMEIPVDHMYIHCR